jgi:hypothetical protein
MQRPVIAYKAANSNLKGVLSMSRDHESIRNHESKFVRRSQRRE